MRGTILTTDEFAEFGKTAVVLTLTINDTEAQRIIDDLPSPDDPDISNAARMLLSYLQVIADRTPQNMVDRVNTDGRYPEEIRERPGLRLPLKLED